MNLLPLRPEAYYAHATSASFRPARQRVSMTEESTAAVTVRVAAAQKRFTPGDRAGNLQVHLRAIEEALPRGIDLLVFPELSLTGMVGPSEVPALALRPDSADLQRLATASKNGPSLVVGFIELSDNYLFYNSQAYLEDGEIRAIQRKIYLPGYGFLTSHKPLLRAKLTGPSTQNSGAWQC